MIETCIYCECGFVSELGEGDHVIPGSLGEFEGDIRFRRMCRECNSKVGHAEQQLVQSGPESIFRVYAKAKPGRRRNRKPTRLKGAKGAPPPRHTVDLGDHSMLVDTNMSDPRDSSPVDQIVIQNHRGEEFYIRLWPGQKIEQFRHALETTVLGKPKVAWLHCDARRFADYQSFLESVRYFC